jgi:hypothetical protein
MLALERLCVQFRMASDSVGAVELVLYCKYMYCQTLSTCQVQECRSVTVSLGAWLPHVH